ncbi:hypothetical protein HOK021_00570 [Streptomyces hygroscopicus]|nr:hypothetical protein HOK021_00570 [Streptomyces hygroscopicus]
MRQAAARPLSRPSARRSRPLLPRPLLPRQLLPRQLLGTACLMVITRSVSSSVAACGSV